MAKVGEKVPANTELVHKLGVPVTSHDGQELSRRGVRHLGTDPTGEPVPEEVGHQEQRGGCLELGRACTRDDLVQGVERQQLDAGTSVEVGHWDLPQDELDDAVGATVPVVDRVAEESPVAIEEPEVDTPAVDAHRVELAGVPPGFSQTIEDGPVERQGVPVQHAADGYGPVPEPCQLLEMELLVAKHAEDHSAARSAEIDGDMVRCRWHL